MRTLDMHALLPFTLASLVLVLGVSCTFPSRWDQDEDETVLTHVQQVQKQREQEKISGLEQQEAPKQRPKEKISQSEPKEVPKQRTEKIVSGLEQKEVRRLGGEEKTSPPEPQEVPKQQAEEIISQAEQQEDQKRQAAQLISRLQQQEGGKQPGGVKIIRLTQPEESSIPAGTWTPPSSPDLGEYPPAKGLKKTIAVLTFENRTKEIEGSALVGEGMTEMLVTELFKSQHFILVERSALNESLQEQELGQTGLVRSGTAARVGQLLGAQLLIKGVVSEFAYKQSGGAFGIQFRGMGLGTKSSMAHVGLDIRIIDANTAEIIDAHHVKQTASARGFSIDYIASSEDLKIGTTSFENTPLGQAVRAAIHEAILYLISKSQSVPWKGLVIKADGDNIYLNKGRGSNLRVGQKLVLYAKGEDLIDPITGIVLGADEERIGSLTITKVKDKYSIGHLDREGVSPCKKGDIVRLE